VTNLKARFEQQIHFFVKPAMNLFLGMVWSQVKELFEYKEKHGWRSQFVMRLRAALEEFFQSDIDVGLYRDKNVREWVRQIVYMTLLRMDVEAPLAEKRWKKLVMILKKHGLV